MPIYLKCNPAQENAINAALEAADSPNRVDAGLAGGHLALSFRDLNECGPGKAYEAAYNWLAGPDWDPEPTTPLEEEEWSPPEDPPL